MRGKEKTSMPVEDVIMVSVPVTDQGRALAFYVGTLGLKLARVDETMLGIRRIQVTGNGTTCLSLVTWCESMPPGCLRGLVLRSSDLAADYQRLVAAGVEFDGPPFAGPDGTCQAVCYDPDGNALVLQSDSTERVTREPRKAARAPQASPDAAVPGEPVAAESGAKADLVTKLRPPAA
jgi:predicted enzyme related to lactoylglutathione lyase